MVHLLRVYFDIFGNVNVQYESFIKDTRNLQQKPLALL